MFSDNCHSMSEMIRAGCTSPRGVRHWEMHGLLGLVARSPGGTRRYTEAQMMKARVIAAAQFGGWGLDEIKAMLENYDTEVYQALMTRLSNQVHAAVRLGDNLPKPAPAMEYDL